MQVVEFLLAYSTSKWIADGCLGKSHGFREMFEMVGRVNSMHIPRIFEELLSSESVAE
jgi:hypothetical protein